MASAPLSVKAWEHLGASVIVLPYSETYLALKQGTVDAVTCPVTDALYQKFCEVAPHLTVTHEYQQQVAVVMNEKRFQSLTKEQQEILYDALREAGDICTKLAIENGEKLVKKMKESTSQFHEIDLAVGERSRRSSPNSKSREPSRRIR
jgi:TRAP-type C4-dicarboxylate transport system substrate-binding protein